MVKIKHDFYEDGRVVEPFHFSEVHGKNERMKNAKPTRTDETNYFSHVHLDVYNG